jgi:hypothetical protein
MAKNNLINADQDILANLKEVLIQHSFVLQVLIVSFIQQLTIPILPFTLISNLIYVQRPVIASKVSTLQS